MRWFELQRLDWIEETLRVFGFINRDHLMKKFGISAPQAANDFREFNKHRPGSMQYDKSAKRYVRGKADVQPS